MLAWHGWRGDAVDREIIGELIHQGFTPAEITRAYVDTHRTGTGRLRVARAARFRALRLPDREIRDCLRSKLSLTRWHNEELVGGRGLKKGGVFLTILGALSVAAGLVVIAVDFWPRDCSGTGWYDECDEHDEWRGLLSGILGLPFILGGVLELSAGIPMWLIGNARLKRWVPPGALDGGDRYTLRRYRADRSQSARPGPRFAVSPVLTRHGGGVALQLRF